jgi:uncharacterized protein YhbP (UPF0306 family)
MDKRITDFIESQKNLTVCTATDNQPYCASCFYAFNPLANTIIFKSGKETKHIVNALQNNQVAGTIVPDISKTGSIRGIQFTGRFAQPGIRELEKARSTYYKKHPLALASPGELWIIELTSIKMIDTTLGIGKKLSWEKETLAKI